VRRLDPRRARHADRERLALHPVVRHDDRARAQAPQGRRPVQVERDDRVVDGHQRDREVVALRVPDLQPDLARSELRAAHVELVGRWRLAAHELDDAIALRDDERDGEREQQHRHERPGSPLDDAPCGARLHRP
jgi:hypothetical protein